MRKSYRNKLLWLASFLDRRAAAIRRYVREHTPKRKGKLRFVISATPDPSLPSGVVEFRQDGRVVGRITGVGND